MNQKTVFSLLLIVLVISACLPINKVTEQPPLPTTTETPDVVPSQEDVPATSSWRAVRDPRYGFGLAVPCWWLVRPIPVDSMGGGVFTISNYDEAYFLQHSSKGFWDWPNGSLKIEIVVMEGVDPANSNADAYMDFVDPSMTALVSADAVQIGEINVTVATLANLVNTNDPDIKIFIYRPSPAILFFVVPTPQAIIESPDFQALLNSMVLSTDEEIELPTITPAPALIDASCAG